MHLPVPHVRQHEDYTCGPAALAMVLSYHRTPAPMPALLRATGANERVGTTRRRMVGAAREFGLHAAELRRSSIAALGALLRRDLPPIVLYMEPEGDPHYAVVASVAGGMVTLQDPWHGPRYRFSHREFLRRWYDQRGGSPRWALALRPHASKR